MMNIIPVLIVWTGFQLLLFFITQYNYNRNEIDDILSDIVLKDDEIIFKYEVD